MILVDTGVLYALADDDDTHHRACLVWLQAATDELVVPSLVITEAAYLIASREARRPKRSSSTPSRRRPVQCRRTRPRRRHHPDGRAGPHLRQPPLGHG